MRNPLRSLSLMLGLLLPFVPAVAQVPPVQPRLSVAQLQEDLVFLKKSIQLTHPNLAFSTNIAQLDLAYKKLERQLQTPMTRAEAWRVFGALNPVYNDAHLQVSMGEFGADAAAHTAGGGGFFPFEVQVDASGELSIRAEVGGAPSVLGGMRIETINGVSARQVTRQLLALTFGDNPMLRANLLSGRWWRFYWKSFGTPERFDLTLATPSGPTRIMRAAVALPPSSDADFSKTYHFEMLPGGVGLLTVNSFMWPDRKLFYAFTEKVFTTLRDTKATSLLIDVRENGGGDDPMWKEGLLRYLADKPYRHGSTYEKKVIAGRAGAGETVGDIVKGEIVTWHQPELANPLHFSGKTYVLMGRNTYSSSILFINTMQDFKFGTLVGEGGYARARQSGGIQHMVLPNSKWGVIVPRFILDRPSGTRTPELVYPDLVLPDSPLDSRALINALLARIAPAKP
ncbi:MAG: S41 family peptidase [Telluria sp.]